MTPGVYSMRTAAGGNSRSVRDHRMSAAQLTMVIGAVVIITSTGASIEVKCMPAPEPI